MINALDCKKLSSRESSHKTLVLSYIPKLTFGLLETNLTSNNCFFCSSLKNFNNAASFVDVVIKFILTPLLMYLKDFSLIKKPWIQIFKRETKQKGFLLIQKIIFPSLRIYLFERPPIKNRSDSSTDISLEAKFKVLIIRAASFSIFFVSSFRV